MKDNNCNVAYVSCFGDLHRKKFEKKTDVIVRSADYGWYFEPCALDRHNIQSITLVEGKPGIYSTTEDGNMILRGGAEGGALSLCLDQKEDVIIPDGISTIDINAFCDTHIRSVKIPDSVIEIRNYAFYGCTQLETVELPSSAQKLGRTCFPDAKLIRISKPVPGIIDAAANGTEQVSVNFCIECNGMKHIFPRNMDEDTKALAEKCVFKSEAKSEKGVKTYSRFAYSKESRIRSATEIILHIHDTDAKRLLVRNAPYIFKHASAVGEAELIRALDVFRNGDILSRKLIRKAAGFIPEEWLQARAYLLSAANEKKPALSLEVI